MLLKKKFTLTDDLLILIIGNSLKLYLKPKMKKKKKHMTPTLFKMKIQNKINESNMKMFVWQDNICVTYYGPKLKSLSDYSYLYQKYPVFWV